MKKTFKRAVTLFLAVALVCSLCGCTALDEMRKNQVFYDEQDNIVCDGVTYKLLPASDYFNPEMDYSTRIYLTEPDVPVLLSVFFAKGTFFANPEGTIITDYEKYYCAEDKYDELCQRLQEGFAPEVVCYFYDVYNKDTWELEEKYYTLTQEQVEAIELVATTVEPVPYTQTGMYPEYIYSLDIIECSADMLLQTCSATLLVGSDRYYLELYTDTDTLVFTVPEGCNEIFGKIVSAYEKANQWADEEDMGV